MFTRACKKCQHLVTFGNKFCPHCGQKRPGVYPRDYVVLVLLSPFILFAAAWVIGAAYLATKLVYG